MQSIAISILNRGLACVLFAFSTQTMAQQIDCVPATKFEAMGKKLLELSESYQEHAKQKLDMSATRMRLLNAIQQCQGTTSNVNDILDALSFRDPACNKDIRQYNALLEQDIKREHPEAVRVEGTREVLRVPTTPEEAAAVSRANSAAGLYRGFGEE